MFFIEIYNIRCRLIFLNPSFKVKKYIAFAHASLTHQYKHHVLVHDGNDVVEIHLSANNFHYAPNRSH